VRVGSCSGFRFSYTNYDNWNTNTNVSAHQGIIKIISSTHPANMAKNKITLISSLGVKSKNLTGDKITIEEILDKSVMILDYRTGDSKFSRDGTCLTLQIEYEGKVRVIFTGSGVLKEDLETLSKDDFPFTSTIIKVPFKDKQFFFKFT